MQIRKTYQKLIPRGIEARFNLVSKKNLKATITKTFNSQYEAESWFTRREIFLCRAFQNLEVLCSDVKVKL